MKRYAADTELSINEKYNRPDAACFGHWLERILERRPLLERDENFNRHTRPQRKIASANVLDQTNLIRRHGDFRRVEGLIRFFVDEAVRREAR